MSEEDSPYVIVDDYFVNWGSGKPLIHFPYHVQEILYELALNFLINQPNDTLEYCLDFFVKLKSSKQIDIVYDLPEEDKETDLATQRRKSVFGESYDPLELGCSEDFETPHPKTEEERTRLFNTLPNVLFFRNLDASDLNKIVDAMFVKPVAKGEMVIQQGDDGDFFYVVQSGIFNAFQTENEVIMDLTHYANSGYFGELALLYNQPRAASVVALTDGILWALDRDTFQRIVLSSSYKRSIRLEDMIRKVPILNSLHQLERMRLADALVTRHYSDGQEIIRQGDPGDGMYFIEYGTVDVVREDAQHQDVLVNQLSDGDYFGELALLTLKPRICSVIARGNVKVAFLEVSAFERMLGPCMDIMKRNIAVYEEQLIELGLLDPCQHITDA
ncbi:cAMP-dependent protein kinase type II regulatory subunit [Halyomorpha halys]|uniref:cAMP-dependent protein kinase type II regulatory subunit n=1 Tax=Halyomorpha halys TaxID=286706 RepID=UPI0006D5200E|nr:cAMP-dependent protein kinase type II regulatory subunit-like [Halyomorpha halys]